MSALPYFDLTPEEYLEIERRAEFKSEYHDGHVFVMAGATVNHIQIVANLTITLTAQTRSQGCRTLPNEMKVWVAARRRFYYPDVTVACGGLQFYDDRRDTILNPVLLIEVLSESTAAYDRGDKFLYYQQLESLREYLLVSQHRPVVEHYVKQDDGSWKYMAYIGLESSLTLPALSCALALSDVYADVEWENEPETNA